MLGSLIIFLKGIRRVMFQLSGFYYMWKLLARRMLEFRVELPDLRRRIYAETDI